MNRNETVSLEYRVCKAFEGKYYIGHTPVMTLQGQNAWGGLINPQNTCVNVFINTFTVSNYSDMPCRAQVWLNAPPGHCFISPFASPSNTVKVPQPESRAQVVYQPAADVPDEGLNLLSRIVHGNDTAIGNYYGKIVIPPGGSFLVLLYAQKGEMTAEIALGWWEDRTLPIG